MDNNGFNYDDYWIGRGKKFLDNGLENFKKTMKSYENYLDGFSLAALVGASTLEAYLKTTEVAIFLLLVVPILILQGVKYHIKVGLADPTITKLDPRNPKRIQLAHDIFFNRLRLKVKDAKGWVLTASFIAIISIPTAVFLHNYLDKEKQELADAKTVDKIDIKFYENTLTIAGLLNDSEDLDILINAQYLDSEKKDTLLKLKQKIKKSEDFNHHFYLGGNKDFRYKKITVEYSVNNRRKAFIKEILKK